MNAPTWINLETMRSTNLVRIAPAPPQMPKVPEGNRENGEKIIEMCREAGFEATFDDLERLDYFKGRRLTVGDVKRIVEARWKREDRARKRSA